MKNQKKSARSKFQHASLDDKQEFFDEVSNAPDEMEWNDLRSEEDEQRMESAPDNQPLENEEHQPNSEKQLSVDVQRASQITGITTLIIRQIWSKAVDLTSSTDCIAPAPGCSKMACMVASTSLPKPHFVRYSRFECDEDCPAFLQRYIRSSS